MVQIGSQAGPVAPIVAPMFRNKHIDILGYSNFLVPFEARRAAYEKMTRYAVAGKLHLDAERSSLADIAKTWERLKAGKGHKLVVTP